MTKYIIELDTVEDISENDLAWLIAKNISVSFIGIRKSESNDKR